MALHELDERVNDGLRVTLYWQDEDNTLTVEVEDRHGQEGDRVITGIPPADRELAFRHPYGYRSMAREREMFGVTA